MNLIIFRFSLVDSSLSHSDHLLQTLFLHFFLRPIIPLFFFFQYHNPSFFSRSPPRSNTFSFPNSDGSNESMLTSASSARWVNCLVFTGYRASFKVEWIWQLTCMTVFWTKSCDGGVRRRPDEQKTSLSICFGHLHFLCCHHLSFPSSTPSQLWTYSYVNSRRLTHRLKSLHQSIHSTNRTPPWYGSFDPSNKKMNNKNTLCLLICKLINYQAW